MLCEQNSMLWEQNSMLWEQDIILREQNKFFSRMVLINHRRNLNILFFLLFIVIHWNRDTIYTIYTDNK
jgi:hypothetical protein